MSGPGLDPVLPVGLALGRGRVADTSPHRVANTGGVELLDPHEWQVWSLAAAAGEPRGGLDRARLQAAARELGAERVSSVYYGLLERRLLIETDSRGEWAERVTMHALLSGLGQLDREGTQYALGVIGETPMVRLDAASYDAWQWLPFGPTLGAAAKTLGVAGGVADFRTVTDRVATLIARGAAYLLATKERQ